MQKKLNCWEYMKCGREASGSKIKELGICPAAITKDANGINGGNCGGRACWAIAGTFCGGKVQGTIAIKIHDCSKCEFLKMVMNEEGDNLIRTTEIINRLSKK